MWQDSNILIRQHVSGLFLMIGCLYACQNGFIENPEAPNYVANPHDTHLDQGYEPNPEFVPADMPQFGVVKQPLRVEGEVLVIEGAPGFVTEGNGGGFGITSGNQVAIVQEVLSQYPDRFDTVTMFLSFTDANNMGTAYYQGVRNVVTGIGRSTYNSRRSWGLSPRGGRFSGFVNMNSVEMFGGLSSAGSMGSRYHAVLAQELSHRWLMFFQYKDGDGKSSEELLGRQDAHWSPLVHAYASVQDGVAWRDNGDGTFTHMGSERGYAPLDLYGMGVFGPDEVEDFFHITDASFQGESLDKSSRIPMGATIEGTKVDVTMQQVLDEMGPRNPPRGTETPYYRTAFVLVTRPGQQQSDWQPYLEAVQDAQRTFPATWKEWALGASALCTTVTAECPEPILGLQTYRMDDGNDGDIGPGEKVTMSIAVRNDGLGTADNVSVQVNSLTDGVTVTNPTTIVSGIEQGKFVDVAPGFELDFSSELSCGTTVSLEVVMTSQEGPQFADKIEFVIGYRQLKYDPLHEAPNWTVDPEQNDTASAGIWGLDKPDFISILGVVTQPENDNSPGDGKLSFHTGPYKGANFSSEDVDGGKTTLESPVFAIGDAVFPSLVYYAWHVAKDFSKAGGPIDVDADLIVSASSDGGETWIEIDRVSDTTKDWTRREVVLKEFVEPSNRMRFKFEIEDLSDSATVEAGIDDIEIVDILASCPVPSIGGGPNEPLGRFGNDGSRDDTEGCGCRNVNLVHSDSLGSSAGLLMLLGLFALRKRKQ